MGDKSKELLGWLCRSEGAPKHRFGVSGIQMVAAGWPVVPIQNSKKGPREPGWQNMALTVEQAEAFSQREYRNGNVGLLTRNFPAVDIDVTIEEAAVAIEQCALEHFGPAPARFGKYPKRLLLYRTDRPFKKVAVDLTAPDGTGHKVEILGEGQQLVAYGKHPDGDEYRWWGDGPRSVFPGPAGEMDGGPLELFPEALETITLEQVIEFIGEVLPGCLPAGWKVGAAQVRPSSSTDAAEIDLSELKSPVEDVTIETARADLEHLSADCPYDEWLAVGAALHHQFDGDEEALELWDEWSAREGNYRDGVCADKWASFHLADTGVTTYRSVLKRVGEVKKATVEAKVPSILERIAAATERKTIVEEIVPDIRDLKEEFGLDALACADIDKALQKRLKELSPVGAALSISEVRKLTRVHFTPEALQTEDGPAVLDPEDAMGIARIVVERRFRAGDERSAVRALGAWYKFDQGCYRELEEESIRSTVWRLLDKAKRIGEEGVTSPFKPNRNDVTNVVDAMRAYIEASLPHGVPGWLPGYDGPDPMNLISMKNGLLDISTGELLDHTAGLFTLNCLPFEWNPEATAPTWRRFLDDIWGDDVESQNVLQEMFGYCLTADTSMQKIFMMIGPKRSGKGTIGRVLGELVGRDNRSSPTMATLAESNGLESLIGKLIAIIADARSGGRDQQMIVERMLMISGEDNISFNRKYKSYWTGKLPTRLVIMSNEMLQLGDASGALAGRLLILQMRRSFYGHEDASLTGRLMDELPGIFVWALEGKRRLAERGRFIQPKSAEELVRHTLEINNPVGVFMEDCCEIGPDKQVSVDNLFVAWRSWCHSENRSAGTKATFGKSLVAAQPSVHRTKPRREGRQVPTYSGIGLNAIYTSIVDDEAFESL